MKKSKSASTSDLVASVTRFTAAAKQSAEESLAPLTPPAIEKPPAPIHRLAPAAPVEQQADDEPAALTIYMSSEEALKIDTALFQLKVNYRIKTGCNRSSISRFALKKLQITPEIAEEFRQFLADEKEKKRTDK